MHSHHTLKLITPKNKHNIERTYFVLIYFRNIVNQGEITGSLGHQRSRAYAQAYIRIRWYTLGIGKAYVVYVPKALTFVSVGCFALPRNYNTC